jgi:hypothetical protein
LLGARPVPSKNHHLLQHHYWYCANGKVVLIQATSSTPEGEAEVKKVLETVAVARP